MTKINIKPNHYLYPLPTIMVSCGNSLENYNIITIAWTGTMCSSPPICYVSLRPERHSYQLIKESGEFVINLTPANLCHEMDWCGVNSGKKFNKFEHLGLTPVQGNKVSAPLIKESPLNMECIVKDVLKLGSHHAFVAEIVDVHVDESIYNPETEKIDLDAANLIAYSYQKYFELGKFRGKYGYSNDKK